MTDDTGKHVPLSDHAELFGSYLSGKHWAAPSQPPPQCTTPIGPPVQFDLSPFTEGELNRALRRAKKHKSAGPDDAPTEFWQWLDPDGRRALLALFNRCWSTATSPTSWQVARIAEIYKGKGSPTDPEMYRPISLLSTAYKIYTRLLHGRLSLAVEHKLRSTQYGFRTARSTTQPLFVVRRLQDMADEVGGSLFLVLLDWEKAFDKVHPEGLLTALQRMGVPQHFIEIVRELNSHPQFFVRANGQDSSTHTSQSGIRQGCPLSPSLFIILHTVIMHDVEVAVRAKLDEQNDPYIPYVHSAQVPLFDLAYADDTLIVARTARVAEFALHSIESIALQYNLRLNKSKCEYLRMFAQSPISFSDGTELKLVGDSGAKYLGAILTADGRASKEISARIQKAALGVKAVSHFWKHTSLSRKWKVRVYTSTFLPQLLYGLETLVMTNSELHRLEVFHHRCLRKALGIPATYYTKVLRPDLKTHSHEEVRQLAGVPTITELVAKRRMVLLGHILRAPQSDLLKNVCFTERWTLRGLSGTHRVGRPRQSWIPLALQEAWHRYHSFQQLQTPLFLPHSLLTLASLSTARAAWYYSVCERQSAQLRG